MNRRLSAIVLGALCGIATAQPTQAEKEALELLTGTIYVRHHRDSADGTLNGCGLEFAALSQDRSTMRGAPVKIVGSYDLRSFPMAGLGYSLKLGIYDGLAWTHPLPPNNAFVRAPRGRPPASTTRLPAETSGYALFFGSIDDSSEWTLTSILDDGELVIGFNRAPGQQDVIITLDLYVEDTQMTNGQVVRKRSPQMVNEFLACVEDLKKSVVKTR